MHLTQFSLVLLVLNSLLKKTLSSKHYSMHGYIALPGKRKTFLHVYLISFVLNKGYFLVQLLLHHLHTNFADKHDHIVELGYKKFSKTGGTLIYKH